MTDQERPKGKRKEQQEDLADRIKKEKERLEGDIADIFDALTDPRTERRDIRGKKIQPHIERSPDDESLD
jgi:hypothetical protein